MIGLEKDIQGFKEVPTRLMCSIRDIGLLTAETTGTIMEMYVSGHCITSEGKSVYLRTLTPLLMGGISPTSHEYILGDEPSNPREKPHPSKVVRPLDDTWARVVLIFENPPIEE